PAIVVSNQSGVGRGYFSETELFAVQQRVTTLLGDLGARLDAAYFCVHAPGANGEPACACRKPGIELYRRAAREHDLDLGRSWYVGDRWRDVAPAGTLGGSGLLIPAVSTPTDDLARAEGQTAPSLDAAVSTVLARV
ncbi:MAG: HAD-IIIA family hydrolase, partial [Gemmatimonadaceae bacterium]